MIDNNIAWFFAFGFGIALFTVLVKHYIDNKVSAIYSRFDSTERIMFDEDMAIRNCVSKRIDNLEHEIERQRTNVWREIDSLWDNKEAKCDKAMSKNYYNSDAGSGCCKTSDVVKSAAEFLKG